MTPAFVSELFRDYFADAASISAGVPDNTTLIKQAITDAKVAKPPRLMVAVKLNSEKSNNAKQIFDIDLVLSAEQGKTLVEGESTRATLEAWAELLRARLEEHDAGAGEERFHVFAEWIQDNRTEEQRTGWQINKLRLFPSEGGFEIEPDEKLEHVRVPLALTVHIR